MTIFKQRNETELTMILKGRVDTATAPLLEKELSTSLDGVEKLILDFENVEYVSSAGLRVILAAHKTMRDRDGMRLRHVNEIVQEVFDVTGLGDVLDIE